MGISRLTAMIIQGNEVNVEPYRSRGKYGFIVSRMENGNYREILSSDSNYDTKERAELEGNNLVLQIKDLDLTKV